MKKIIVLLALVGIFGVLRAQDIQVPTYDSEFDMTPASFTVGADGGKFSFKLTCDQYGGLLRAEAVGGDIRFGSPVSQCFRIRVHRFRGHGGSGGFRTLYFHYPSFARRELRYFQAQ